MSASELIATCPKCGATHPVPIEAAGRPARCQTCGQIFLIPNPKTAEPETIDDELNDLMEGTPGTPADSGHSSEAEIDETISTWLNEDFEEEEDQKESEREKRLESEAYEHRRKMMRKEEQEKMLRASQNPDFLNEVPSPAQDQVMDEIDQRILEAQARTNDEFTTEKSTARKESRLREKISQEAVAAMETPASLTDDEASLNRSSFETAAHPDSTSAHISTLGLPSDTNLTSELGTTAEEVIKNLVGTTASQVVKNKEDTSGKMPGGITAGEPLPYLGVKSYDRLGVTLIFDPQWIKMESFRLSTPTKCFITGDENLTNLLIRPILFEGTLGDREPERIDSIMQRPMMHDQPIKEAIALMGDMEYASAPYNMVIPCFVTEDQQFQRIRAWLDNHHGQTVCSILIADPGVALQWVRSVNGVCDLGYRLLKEKVEKPKSSGMPDWIMDRLNIWCKLNPGESVDYYVRDADLLAREEGLGGIVITNQRVIFHKAKKTGQFPIDEKALITIKPADETVVRIAVDSRTIRSKMGKISREKLPELLSYLAGRDNLSFFNM